MPRHLIGPPSSLSSSIYGMTGLPADHPLELRTLLPLAGEVLTAEEVAFVAAVPASALDLGPIIEQLGEILDGVTEIYEELFDFTEGIADG